MSGLKSTGTIKLLATVMKRKKAPVATIVVLNILLVLVPAASKMYATRHRNLTIMDTNTGIP